MRLSKLTARKHFAPRKPFSLCKVHNKKFDERNETNYKGRIFLESLHSSIDKNSVNERMEFLWAYVPLLRSLESRNMKQ